MLDVAFGLGQLPGQRFLPLRRSVLELLPQNAQALFRHVERDGRGLHFSQHVDECALDLAAPDRLLVRLAIAIEAVVIRMARSIPALRQAACQGLAAAAAGHETAQREVCAVVLAHDAFGRALQASLDALEGFERNQCRVMARTHGNIPIGHVHVSGVERIGQDTVRIFIAHPAR
ncbi:MAG: hypothetical protein WDN24_08440 [Sphingomonas sp.]